MSCINILKDPNGVNLNVATLDLKKVIREIHLFTVLNSPVIFESTHFSTEDIQTSPVNISEKSSKLKVLSLISLFLYGHVSH